MTEYRDRTFDWVPSRDPQNANYLLRTILPLDVDLRYIHWGLPSFRIDQGPDGACVGFSCMNEALASPMRVKASSRKAAEKLAYELYREMQEIDEWVDNTEGTSVNAGAKVMRAHGYIDGWRWAESTDDIKRALCAPARKGGGPVVFGSAWYERMFEPEAGNFIVPGGAIVGGHAYLIVGYHPERRVAGEPTETFTILNSWGPKWGRKGMAYITANNLDILFATGEAAVFQGRDNP